MNIYAPHSYYLHKAESTGDARRNRHKHTITENFNIPLSKRQVKYTKINKNIKDLNMRNEVSIMCIYVCVSHTTSCN